MSWSDLLHVMNDGVLDAAGAWWVLPVLFVLCCVDGFFPVVPSESLMVALASIWISWGFLSAVVLVLVGAAGAFLGDQIAFRMGRLLGSKRFKWMCRPKVAKVFDTAERQLRRRGAALIFSARYIPIGRVAVNITAGATGFSAKRFALLDAVGCLLWGVYSVSIGALAGNWMEHNRLLGILLSVVGAVILGWVLDRVVHLVLLRRVPEPQVEAAYEHQHAVDAAERAQRGPDAS